MKSLAALALLGAALPAAACPGLAVENAWIREAPPGALMTAAYAQLANRSAQALVVDGAFGADFAAAELHRTVVENGMFRMNQDVLPIAPGARAALEPGGWHLMLMRPARPLKAGDTVPLALKCGKQAREFTFTVKAAE
jgi:copper(I)-binding protein